MTHPESRVYEFVYRGQLAEQALDSAGRKNRRQAAWASEETAKVLSLDLLDDQHVDNARAMANVYIAVASFENSVRDLITSVLSEQVGANWWEACVSEKIRTRAQQKIEEEDKVRWHVQRGASPINYTLMSDLVSILRQNWTHFEPHIPTIEWAAGLMDVIERSRNVIMHSGMLSRTDVERVGIYIRDWIKQVGA
jgi:Swt1-like HEPN